MGIHAIIRFLAKPGKGDVDPSTGARLSSAHHLRRSDQFPQTLLPLLAGSNVLAVEKGIIAALQKLSAKGVDKIDIAAAVGNKYFTTTLIPKWRNCST
jgi:hypothetical protein